MFFEFLKHLLKLLLFLLVLSQGSFILLLIGHGHHRQDQIDEVEGTQEDDDHEEDHVGLASGSKGLGMWEKGGRGLMASMGPSTWFLLR